VASHTRHCELPRPGPEGLIVQGPEPRLAPSLTVGERFDKREPGEHPVRQGSAFSLAREGFDDEGRDQLGPSARSVNDAGQDTGTGSPAQAAENEDHSVPIEDPLQRRLGSAGQRPCDDRGSAGSGSRAGLGAEEYSAVELVERLDPSIAVDGDKLKVTHVEPGNLPGNPYGASSDRDQQDSHLLAQPDRLAPAHGFVRRGGSYPESPVLVLFPLVRGHHPFPSLNSTRPG
jgi:hypothetical protein